MDEKGCIEEATAVSGHPLLLPNSVKIAYQSVFEPVILSGNPVKVTGVIIYNYLPNQLNRLGLGYSSDSETTLIEYLPREFDRERETIRNLSVNFSDERAALIQRIVDQIEAQLASQPKSQWLWNIGRQLKLFRSSCWDGGSCEEAKRPLRELLLEAPSDISILLKVRLQELIDENGVSVIKQKHSDLVDRLFDLGN